MDDWRKAADNSRYRDRSPAASKYRDKSPERRRDRSRDRYRSARHRDRSRSRSGSYSKSRKTDRYRSKSRSRSDRRSTSRGRHRSSRSRSPRRNHRSSRHYSSRSRYHRRSRSNSRSRSRSRRSSPREDRTPPPPPPPAIQSENEFEYSNTNSGTEQHDVDTSNRGFATVQNNFTSENSCPSIGPDNSNSEASNAYDNDFDEPIDKERIHREMEEKLRLALAKEGKVYPPPKPEPSHPVFANDGSFLEIFKKMQQQMTQQQANADAAEQKLKNQPICKRRGGKILKTGIVAKSRATDPNNVDPKDFWSLYLQEVKKYKNTSCDVDSKTRPLVK